MNILRRIFNFLKVFILAGLVLWFALVVIEWIETGRLENEPTLRLLLSFLGFMVIDLQLNKKDKE